MAMLLRGFASHVKKVEAAASKGNKRVLKWTAHIKCYKRSTTYTFCTIDCGFSYQEDASCIVIVLMGWTGYYALY